MTIGVLCNVGRMKLPVLMCLLETCRGVVKYRDALLGEFPWAASISFYPTTHYAAGSVVSPYYVLTTCYLMFTEQKGEMKAYYKTIYVMAGNVKFVDYFKPPTNWIGQWRNGTTVHYHPKCKPVVGTGGWYYDFAMIQLDRAFELNVNLKPLKVPDSKGWDRLQIIASTKMACSTLGWYPGLNENNLVVFNINLMDFEQCQVDLCQWTRLYCHINLKERFQVCGDTYREGARDRGGMRGGTLICESFVYAMTVRGTYFGKTGCPVLHISLSVASEWIAEVIKDGPQPESNAPVAVTETGLRIAILSSIVSYFFAHFP